jgi:hypothetical protein
LQRMQHPLSEDAVVVGLLPNALSASVPGLLATLRRLFATNGTPEHPLVGGSLPTHVVLPPSSPLATEHLRELFWLVASLSSDGGDLDTATAELLRHRGDPWKRASEAFQAAFSRIGQTTSADEAGRADPSQIPATSSAPTPEQFARWWTAVTDPEHVQSELEAMPSAWDGAKELVAQRSGPGIGGRP